MSVLLTIFSVICLVLLYWLISFVNWLDDVWVAFSSWLDSDFQTLLDLLSSAIVSLGKLGIFAALLAAAFFY